MTTHRPDVSYPPPCVPPTAPGGHRPDVHGGYGVPPRPPCVTR